jgi:small subunit ribosomal protein S3
MNGVKDGAEEKLQEAKDKLDEQSMKVKKMGKDYMDKGMDMGRDLQSKAEDMIGDYKDEAESRMNEMKDRAEDKLQEAKEKAKEKLDEQAMKVKKMGKEYMDKGMDMGREVATDLQNKAKDMLEETFGGDDDGMMQDVMGYFNEVKKLIQLMEGCLSKAEEGDGDKETEIQASGSNIADAASITMKVEFTTLLSLFFLPS